jgi:hypothetical protein
MNKNCKYYNISPCNYCNGEPDFDGQSCFIKSEIRIAVRYSSFDEIYGDFIWMRRENKDLMLYFFKALEMHQPIFYEKLNKLIVLL